jgi:hypothetical protein
MPAWRVLIGGNHPGMQGRKQRKGKEREGKGREAFAVAKQF